MGGVLRGCEVGGMLRVCEVGRMLGGYVGWAEC